MAVDRRRRRWSEAQKRQIVAESREPGVSVSVVARRYNVNANQVFTWRRQYREPEAGPVPVAGDLGRCGVDQRGAARLPARGDRLEEPGSDLATVAGGLIGGRRTRSRGML